jgi:sugar lactone lactonase YvrE
MTNGRLKLIAGGIFLGLAASSTVLAHPESDLPAPPDSLSVTSVVKTGSSDNTYQSVPNWCQLPEGRKTLGGTHGGVVVDKQGLIYFSMQKVAPGILVYSPDGKLVRGICDKMVDLHGLCIHEENGEEFIYAAHLGGHEAVKMKLDGTIVWTIGLPTDSGKYKNAEQYKPTAIAVGPNGHVYVCDGYGQNWVHEYDENQKYVRSFGGPGAEPGKFHTCHGIAIDMRGDKPLLLICDRENHRLQHFDLDGKFVDVVLVDGAHRPCSISFHGKNAAVAELDGRCIIIDGNNKVVSVLGENTNRKEAANYTVPPKDWKEGIFNAPHGISYDKDANLYIEDWNATGRIIKMEHVTAEASAR